MSNISVFENIQSELRVDPATGIGYCSIRGAARIAGVSHVALINSFKTSGDFIPSKMVQSLIAQGFEGGNFVEFSEGEIPDRALALIVHYYAVDAGARCTSEAKAALLAFTLVGIRSVIHDITGYRQSAPTPTPTALPPVAVQVANLADALKFFDIDTSNPRFKQGLQDIVLNTLGITQAALPGSAAVYLGVAEKAERLGYPVGLVIKHRSALGKYVKASGLESTQEERLCNGTSRPINVYLDSPELSVAVCEFMDAKTLATANGGQV